MPSSTKLRDDQRIDEDPAATAAPLRRLADAPDVLRIADIVSLYQVSESYVRHQLADRTFVPRPFALRPFRWLKVDVQADLESRRTSRETPDGELLPPRRQPRRRRRRRAAPTAPDPLPPSAAEPAPDVTAPTS